ncbi:MAG: acyltransferase family protein [Oscillospiraceae bacterium]|nr:acyltransferase family protein [Oscillospiraceae bacterium]
MKKENNGRIYYLDNIKVFLVTLVIIHHVGQAYGPTGGFWPFQSSLGESISTLGRFFAVNAGFFMGFLFLISGYFIPMAFDRNNGERFLTKRLLRFGIPLLFVFLIMGPIQMYFYYTLYSGNLPLSFFQYYTNIWLGIGGMPTGFVDSIDRFPHLNFGHAWFIQHLLVYAAIYWFLRKILKVPVIKQESKPFSVLHLSVIFAVIAVLSLIVRMWYPIDYWVGLLGFFQVEIAHWPQYLVMFVAGITAYRKNWLNTLDTKTGYTCFVIGIITAVYIYMGAPGVSRELWDMFWAVCESLLAVALTFGLLTLFREKCNLTTPILKTLARSSYAAYIFHMPIVLAIQYILDTVVIGGAVGKFVIVSIISVLLTYALCIPLIKVKPLGKIL